MEESMMCPQCKNGKLVKRKGKWGDFLGCNRYPECKYIHKNKTKSSKNERMEQLLTAILDELKGIRKVLEVREEEKFNI